MTRAEVESLRKPMVAAALALLATAPSLAWSQADSVTAIAGERYRAGRLAEAAFGKDYRDLWTTPIRVPLLDLGAYAGGLAPVERGGGMQTISLRFRAGDGREYNFRSVDKDQTGGLHPDFQNTLVDRIAQDQVSSKHPAGALIATALLDAAGVLNPAPEIFVMPDDPRLGEFREEFAGMLGFIEVHPNEGPDDQPLFANAEVVAGAERLLEHIEESPRHRADSREYLKARLMDLFIGDWDRHLGQWRWARYGNEDAYRWVPVPEDRDNAFSDYDGFLLRFARGPAPYLAEFGPDYPDLFGLTQNAQVLDRRLLSDLPREVYDSLAFELQRRLDDRVIQRAVASTPPAYFALRGQELVATLTARRAALPGIAAEFYAQLAQEAEVRATDESDVAVVERMQDGSVEVLIHPAGAADEPYFRRRFLPRETREVRLFLAGGDDRATVRGAAARSIIIRVIGGGGDDVLVDSSSVAAASRTVFYDDRGDNTLVTTSETVVDTREFRPPERAESGFNENQPALRDWGSELTWLRPLAEWRYNVGPVIGGGPSLTRYGFRRVPYADQVEVQALYAPLHTRFALEVDGDFRRTNSPARVSVSARATQLEVTRFHGFGNETPSGPRANRFKIWSTDFDAVVRYHTELSSVGEVFVGPLVRYTRPKVDADNPAAPDRPFGTDPVGSGGVRAGGVVDTRDGWGFPRSGFLARVDGSVFAPVWDVPTTYASGTTSTAAYFRVPLPIETTLALRAGGSIALGDFPLQDAAFVGGPASLRGFPRQRFAGDAALFANAELRPFLTRFNFISRGDLGLIALADAGRVFVKEERSGRWHTAHGGGIWVGILDRTRVLSLVYARGEESALYLSLGMPF